MSCSRFCSGGPCKSAPISSSAMVRSLALISVPFTFAISVSFGSTAAGWDDAEDESFEQPDTTGRTIRVRAAIIATRMLRGRGHRVPGIRHGGGEFRKAMVRVLEFYSD